MIHDGNGDEPVLIRNFALPGMLPGGPPNDSRPNGIHEATVSCGDRKVYLAYGTGDNGVIQVVDCDNPLEGDTSPEDPFATTSANLHYPQINRRWDDCA